MCVKDMVGGGRGGGKEKERGSDEMYSFFLAISGYGPAADMWSIGVITYMLLTGQVKESA